MYRIKISAKKVLENTNIGDSIATNGVCLTVTEIGSNFYTADIMLETLNSTNFKDLKIGERVNLERALILNKRLDGHIVQGHVDSMGRIINIIKDGNVVVYRISCNSDDLRLIVKKGSIALDGISLTVSNVKEDYFEVSIIPTTIRDTTLAGKKVGDTINIETDIIGKYVDKILNLNKSSKSGIDLKFLIENGF